MNNFITIIDSIIDKNNRENSDIQLNYEITEEQEYNNIKIKFTILEDTKVLFSTYIIVVSHIYQECKEDVTYRFQMQVLKELLRYSLEYLKVVDSDK